MKGNEIKFWEIVTEAVTAVLALLFLGLQVYYAYVYETSAVTMLYHLLPPLLLYAGMTALQIFPELLNGAGSEPLKGNVRVYAVRMVRNSKLLVILGIWIPSAPKTANGIAKMTFLPKFPMSFILRLYDFLLCLYI